jgi:hypothetical protein
MYLRDAERQKIDHVSTVITDSFGETLSTMRDELQSKHSISPVHLNFAIARAGVLMAASAAAGAFGGTTVEFGALAEELNDVLEKWMKGKLEKT